MCVCPHALAHRAEVPDTAFPNTSPRYKSQGTVQCQDCGRNVMEAPWPKVTVLGIDAQMVRLRAGYGLGTRPGSFPSTKDVVFYTGYGNHPFFILVSYQI